MTKLSLAQAVEFARGRRELGNTGLVSDMALDCILEEVERLDGVLNTPQTLSFVEAVKAEAAHQQQRWGEAHDRSKSAEHWYWLVGYLAGKALRSAITGDKQKALHHTISSAAALANWHDAILNDESGTGAGKDEDLKPAA